MKKLVLLVAAASAAVLVAACGQSVGSSQAICVDRKTNQRLDDSWCRNDSSGMGWFYLPNGSSAPAVGSRTTSGSWDVPKNTKPVYGGVNKSGGKVDLGKTAPKSSSGSGGSKSSSGSGGSKSSGGSSGGSRSGGSVSSGRAGK
ncbi:putative secreted protein [Rhodococcus phage Mbo2]|uniref:Secreted protein n=1 Tax=Rhodococcus phage Mbo2 TaxID=2936911 RepID=A0A9E7IEH3_9CAUD|nr:putative secreted protein [Rhodococcus phage Mbo2]